MSEFDGNVDNDDNTKNKRHKKVFHKTKAYI